MENPFELGTDERAAARQAEVTHEMCSVAAAHGSADFRLAVPKEWSHEAGVPQDMQGILRPIPRAVFLEPARDGYTLISVVEYRMEMEVELEDWVDHVLAQHSLIPFGGRRVRIPAGEAWDAGVSEGASPSRKFSQVTACAGGGSIYLVTSQCAEGSWPQYREAFLATNLSFQVDAGRPEQTAALERLAHWTSARHSGLAIAYPASWRCEVVPAAKSEAVDFKLPDQKRKRLVAYIRLRLTPEGRPETAESLFAQSVTRLQEAGFTIDASDFKRSREAALEDLAGYEGTWVGMGTWKPAAAGEEDSARVVIRRLEQCWAVVICISPLQRHHPILWMRTRRAAHIILSGART